MPPSQPKPKAEPPSQPQSFAMAAVERAKKAHAEKMAGVVPSASPLLNL